MKKETPRPMFDHPEIVSEVRAMLAEIRDMDTKDVQEQEQGNGGEDEQYGTER